MTVLLCVSEDFLQFTLRYATLVFIPVLLTLSISTNPKNFRFQGETKKPQNCNDNVEKTPTAGTDSKSGLYSMLA